MLYRGVFKSSCFWMPTLRSWRCSPRWSQNTKMEPTRLPWLISWIFWPSLFSSSINLECSNGKISPQYHVIFDDKFETVNSLSPTKSLEKQWAQILRLNQECFLDVDYDKDGNAILPLLSELIKNFSKAKAKTPEFQSLPRFEPTSNPATSK